jgi:electron transfer flavoprotein beta subunit
MNIIVCIKQVPNTTCVEINPETGTLKREGVESVINPFDEYAIEEGVRLKERFGGKTTVVTMGPPQAESALRESISRGVDDAILVSDRAFAGADTLATSYTLAETIKKIGAFDIIICGKQASDGDTAQVGPGIAEQLDIPHIAYIKKIEDIKDNVIRVERMMEDGYDIIESGLPVLITVVKEINVPRLPSLKGMMASKKAVIQKYTAAMTGADVKRLGLDGSPTKVMKIFYPTARKAGDKLKGDVPDMASALVSRLRDSKIV